MFDAPLCAIASQRRDTGSGDNFAALLADQAGERVAYSWIIGDAFLGDRDGRQAGGVWLDFFQLFRTQQAQALQSVLTAALQEIVQAWNLLWCCRDHQLSADVMRNSRRSPFLSW